MTDTKPFKLSGVDGKLIRGDRLDGEGRQSYLSPDFSPSDGATRAACWRDVAASASGVSAERGFGGRFTDHTLCNWLEDAWAVVRMLDQGPPLTIVGSSLGGWLAWLVAQETYVVKDLLLIATIRENVRVQLIHLRTHPAIAARLRRKALDLHGGPTGYQPVRSGHIIGSAMSLCCSRPRWLRGPVAVSSQWIAIWNQRSVVPIWYAVRETSIAA